jgi:hypothetical protein
MKSGLKMFGNVLLRIVAVFAASGLSVIGAGSVAGISVTKAITVAGLTAVAAVVEKLARGFMNDGRLSLDEINSAFAAVDVNSKTAADLQVEANQTGKNIVIAAAATAPVVEEVISGKPDGEVPAEQPIDEDWDKD